MGIPDFRVWHDDVYSAQEKEDVRLIALQEAYNDRGYEVLHDIYCSLPTSKGAGHGSPSSTLTAKWRKYDLGIADKIQRTKTLLRLAGDLPKTPGGSSKQEIRQGIALDLGCKFGPSLVGPAKYFRGVVGVDIDLAALVVARKLLEEYDLSSRVRLVAACAEALPFSDGSLDKVFAVDVIEHVQDHTRMVSEGRRVLKTGEKCILVSPNRLMLCKEPHVGIYGVGFVPRRYQEQYVRIIKGGRVAYNGVRLLSFGELSSLLKVVYGNCWRAFALVYDPSIPPQSRLGQLYRKSRMFQRVLNSRLSLCICSTHTVVAYKTSI